jgi:two-component system invasion response regulator UvrY
MIRVLIADDHPIVRHGLCRLLRLEPDLEVVGEAADGAEVIARIQETQADVLILDLSLPHLRGLELLHEVREQAPSLRVLIFSVQPEDRFALHLLDSGAAGYLCKADGVDAVVTAVRTVAAGRPYLSAALEAHRLADLNAPRDRAPHDRFSPRERQIFDLLLVGTTVNAIAAELEISPSTASNHLARMRAKLGVQTNAEVLVYAVRSGLM